jgi:hypothetical protein
MFPEAELLEEAGRLFESEPKLIELGGKGAFERVVFVGDTHGDLEASERVISRYLKPGTKLVFLGDYVDRGPESRENLLFLLEQKLAHPRDLILLMGNHEGWGFAQFTPADFWLGLSPEEERAYATTLAKLPLVVTAPNGVIALHGALPVRAGLLRAADGPLREEPPHPVSSARCPGEALRRAVPDDLHLLGLWRAPRGADRSDRPPWKGCPLGGDQARGDLSRAVP